MNRCSFFASSSSASPIIIVCPFSHSGIAVAVCFFYITFRVYNTFGPPDPPRHLRCEQLNSMWTLVSTISCMKPQFSHFNLYPHN